MIRLPREMLRAAKVGPVEWGATPLQVGMGGCPWRVCVASMLCNKTRRTVAEPVLKELLERWPTAGDLARADQGALESLLRPLGLQRTRSRRLTRFSSLYTADGWTELRELPGVGAYVADAVGLCVYGCTELESGDLALHGYAALLRGKRARFVAQWEKEVLPPTGAGAQWEKEVLPPTSAGAQWEKEVLPLPFTHSDFYYSDRELKTLQHVHDEQIAEVTPEQLEELLNVKLTERQKQTIVDVNLPAPVEWEESGARRHYRVYCMNLIGGARRVDETLPPRADEPVVVCATCCGAGYVHTNGGEKDPGYAGLGDRAPCPTCS